MLRRIIAAAFTLAALTMPAGATSAVADEYGPADHPCTIELSNGVVPANATATVQVTCDEDAMETFDAAGGGTVATPAMADGDVLATPMVAGELTMATLMAAAGLAMAPDHETVTLMVADDDGEVVHSTAMGAPVDGPAEPELPSLQPGDYTLMLADEDGTECADRAHLRVAPMPPGRDVTPGGGALAATGATGLPYLAVAGGLLVAGVTALVALRRARGRA
ncbi:hypothetical protein GCM10027059_18960 [Myceligenerans halotolerans]